MIKNKHINNWNKEVSIITEAFNSQDFSKSDMAIKKLTEIYEKYKHDCSLKYKCSNFGIANYIFEDTLLENFKSNKKVIKEFINTIKSDKNLLAQHNFIYALKSKSNDSNLASYINEALELLRTKIDIKTLNKSNKKIFDLIEKYDLRPHEKINEASMKFFNTCDYLIKQKKSLSNLNKINESINFVANYTKDNIKHNEPTTDIHQLINEFNICIDKLTDKERYIVETIASYSDQDNAKKNLFESLKNECLSIIKGLQEKSSLDEQNNLENIKVQISNKIYNENTLVEDISKFLEIKDILLS